VDQLQSGHTTDSGITDHQIAHLQAERELDGGQSVIGLENGMAVLEKGLDHQANDGPVLVGDDDIAAVEAVGAGAHWGTLDPGDVVCGSDVGVAPRWSAAEPRFVTLCQANTHWRSALVGLGLPLLIAWLLAG
jgi:hypothetical protein